MLYPEVFAARGYNARVMHPLKNTSLFSIFSQLHTPSRFVLPPSISIAAHYLVQRNVNAQNGVYPDAAGCLIRAASRIRS